MTKRLIAVFSALLLFAFSATTVHATDSDFRVIRMHEVLESYHSPMAGHEASLIDAADKNGLDWTLMAAIAGTESTFGRFMPYSNGELCINPYGWGIYGGSVMCFKSFEDAADTVAQGLATRYNTTSLETIAHTYNTVSTDGWLAHTRYFMNKIKTAEIPVSALPIAL